ncbi:SCP2 sterol-binding domain-containing protein [Solwaraspora sp. WMMD791]|uniref:SCP2 sterol-binding domain-containing protein n=1 Tax=Solwaraspora sp. WMMD791 TaxID=3016086 RepID=UPI00249B2A07|nr:SCP2 sterol-binding domain-containing protein [Solwaraspora sp. WMMD791]WFE27754.1 SCP2 sterol-binding domain-containing protein [Solwaraspora sp. WMMD791]
MSATTEAFFAGLGAGALRLPPTIDATLRFDVRYSDHTEQWWLRFAAGTVAAEQSGADADCVAVIDGPLFERLLRGEERLTPAFVRYAFTIEGDFTMVPAFEWLLPDMVGARHPRQLAQGWGRAR